jgi:hypothetical protein
MQGGTMTTNTPEGGQRSDVRPPSGRRWTGRNTTETKAAYKTTEFYLYLLVAILVLIASWVIGTSHGHNDYFRGDKAWFFVVLLTIGYLLSRGLAKSGRGEPYDDR